MRPLSQQNIESELSYAYLHAAAARVGVGCKVANRHDDNAGVDAELTGWGPFPNGGYRQEVDIKVQLKATIKQPGVVGNFYSYSLSGIKQYNDLRTDTVSTPRILVMLLLPPDEKEWLTLTEDALVLRKCAYWVSLRGAASSTNESSQTVYFPKNQTFDPEGLTDILSRVSRGDIPVYQEVSA
jgi:Domain of unknown function (DUF4365)